MAATPSPHDFPVSWEEMHRNAKALAWRLVDKGPWTAVIGVARGGLIPATIVARELGVRLVDTVCVAHYDEQKILTEPKMLKMLPGDGSGCVVVDDLVDTGRTLQLVRKYLPKAHYATIYTKPDGKPLVDSYVMEVSQDTWIHFPWEQAMTYAEPIISSQGKKS